jgi:anaerobic C4-dicarboxylate transporter
LNIIWDTLIQGRVSSINLSIKSVIGQPDFWLWFYLIFAVSNTMLPSASDRRAWLPLILVMVILLGMVLFIGIGPWILNRLGSTFKSALDAIIMVLGITVLIDLVLLPPTYFIRRVISHFLGLQVV